MVGMPVAILSLGTFKPLMISDLAIAIISVCALILALVLIRFSYLLIKNSRVAPVLRIRDWVIFDFRSLDGGSDDDHESKKSEREVDGPDR
jgi:hypothetical protein